ncbi:unnamed protein product, partial [Mesorhabditis spiculigera]
MTASPHLLTALGFILISALTVRASNTTALAIRHPDLPWPPAAHDVQVQLYNARAPASNTTALTTLQPALPWPPVDHDVRTLAFINPFTLQERLLIAVLLVLLLCICEQLDEEASQTWLPPVFLDPSVLAAKPSPSKKVSLRVRNVPAEALHADLNLIDRHLISSAHLVAVDFGADCPSVPHPDLCLLYIHYKPQSLKASPRAAFRYVDADVRTYDFGNQRSVESCFAWDYIIDFPKLAGGDGLTAVQRVRVRFANPAAIDGDFVNGQGVLFKVFRRPAPKRIQGSQPMPKVAESPETEC